ncbi:MAG: ATP:cob(I)alamin adenosyltransferase [Spirochaetaceae bacterium]
MKRFEFDKVTTRGGDDGRSSRFSGERLFKDDPLFEALGDLDELISYLGVVRRLLPTNGPIGKEAKALESVQRSLMTVCAVFAASPGSEEFARVPKITDNDIAKLEKREKALLDATEIAEAFVVPGSRPASIAEVDVARAMTRRCERHIVAVIRSDRRPDPEARLCQNYVNRLSDYLFVLARACEQDTTHGRARST